MGYAKVDAAKALKDDRAKYKTAGAPPQKKAAAKMYGKKKEGIKAN